MPSFGDLPNEVLTRIRPSQYDLFNLILVSHHFYDVYTPQLYHSFKGMTCSCSGGDYVEYRKRLAKRYIGFYLAIFENPRLASYVRQFRLTHFQDGVLTKYAEDQRHAITPFSSLKSLLYTNTSYASRMFDVLLPRLPGVEELYINMSQDSLMQTLKCSRLKDVYLCDGYRNENAMHQIATLLGHSTLLHLRFELGGSLDLCDLAAIPDRSSGVQHITVSTKYHTITVTDVPINSPLVVQTICSKLKLLKSFCWDRKGQLKCTPDQRLPCQNTHNSCIQPALAPFKDTLEILRLQWSSTEQCRSPIQRSSLGSLRDYTKLHTIQLAPYMLFDEPRTFYREDDLATTRSQNLTGSHARQPAGFFSGLLPSSLHSLRLYADTDRNDRVHTNWLQLVKDLLADRCRLATLKTITITPVRWDGEVGCMSCTWLGESCSLCVRSKISDTMKSLCAKAVIVLRIERTVRFLDDDHTDLDDSASQHYDVVPDSAKFDELEI